MKRIFTLSLFACVLLLSACQYNDRTVKLNFDNSLIEHSSIGNDREIAIIVLDERKDFSLGNKAIGSKQFGGTTVVINAQQDLTEFFADKIAAGLRQQDFFIKQENVVTGRGQVTNEKVAKVLKIIIKSFGYEAKRGFPSGKAIFSSEIAINVLDVKTGSRFERNYTNNNTQKRFISTSQELDESSINDSLHEVIRDILIDQKLLNHLAS